MVDPSSTKKPTRELLMIWSNKVFLNLTIFIASLIYFVVANVYIGNHRVQINKLDITFLLIVLDVSFCIILLMGNAMQMHIEYKNVIERYWYEIQGNDKEIPKNTQMFFKAIGILSYPLCWIMYLLILDNSSMIDVETYLTIKKNTLMFIVLGSLFIVGYLLMKYVKKCRQFIKDKKMIAGIDYEHNGTLSSV
ncbi:MAG: hypothetical protein Edafosvirus21_17 [Edafosvirus sp.]|uniref:Uncharacterized protein n=1 Tax=Edafosvirus sp. TaxID=2487765 RepID=A0A3G4ZUR0_9VIRU|nr:MAG: hypothetical protein Edafosvirus21_17 [Edafosvirus sp.]